MATVLIVDDTTVIRLKLNHILTQAGYIVIDEAEDGKEGVEKYKLRKPDLVTMDMFMPVMDGLEAAELILKENPRAKIIMVTANAEDNAVKEAVKKGVKGYILKPLVDEKVLATVNRVLSG
jgi:two-component system chemotaxis response regulator CheY